MTNKIDRLLEQVLEDKNLEPEFFRALLDWNVYAHIPRYDKSDRVRLIQFVTPERQTVLPFFTDESQAREAAGNTAAIAIFSGRQLMELTRGATLMLNPNKANCTLYPEEITALLDQGEVALVAKEEMPDQQMQFRNAKPRPDWLLEPLIALYKTMDCIDAAYIVEVRMPGAPEKATLLVVMAVAAVNAERAARASITAVQRQCTGKQVGIDLTVFEPGDPPAWLADTGAEEFFSRSISKPPRSMH